MKKVTDYEIRIGNSYDYDDGDIVLENVKITNIIFDGFQYVIEFSHRNKNEPIPSTRNGVTIYPERLKLKK